MLIKQFNSIILQTKCVKHFLILGPCEPGELVFIGFCNLCLCNTKGVPNQLCAKSWCKVSTPLPPRRTINNLTTNKPFV